jgi:hypothetical protein
MTRWIVEVPELPAPDVLWERMAAAGATLDADGALRTGDERNPLRLMRLPEGRAVLTGFSLDHGRTMNRFFGMDTTSQAPDWVPRPLYEQARRGKLGFLYWYDEGVWRRMKYKPEDGVLDLAKPFRDPSP